MYKAHILSNNLERDLDIAPVSIDPIARVRMLKDLIPEITRTNEQFNEEMKKDGDVKSIDYYGSCQNGIQILFYIDEKGLEEITNNGCSILIEETRPELDTSRHIITATPKSN